MSLQIRSLLPVAVLAARVPLHTFRVSCWLSYPVGPAILGHLDYSASTAEDARQQFHRETGSASAPSAFFIRAEPLGAIND